MRETFGICRGCDPCESGMGNLPVEGCPKMNGNSRWSRLKFTLPPERYTEAGGYEWKPYKGPESKPPRLGPRA